MSKIIITENQYIRIFLNESDTPPEDIEVKIQNSIPTLKSRIINNMKTETLPEIESLSLERIKNPAVKSAFSMYQGKIDKSKEILTRIIEDNLDDILSNLQVKECREEELKTIVGTMLSKISAEVKKQLDDLNIVTKKLLKKRVSSLDDEWFNRYFENNIYYPIWMLLWQITITTGDFRRDTLKIEDGDEYCGSSENVRRGFENKCCRNGYKNAVFAENESLWKDKAKEEVKNIFNYIKNMDTDFF